MSSSSSSTVWFFFKKTNKYNLTCNLCGKNYKSSGNTSNLATHLRNKHYHAFSELKNVGGKSIINSEPKIRKSALKQQRRLPFETCSQSSTSTSASITNIAQDVEIENAADLSLCTTSQENYNRESSISVLNNQFKQVTKQPTLMDILERSSSYEAGGQKTYEINQALVYMICKDNMPFSCVEKPGLQKFTSVICPRYKFPSRTTVTSLVDQRYITTKAILKNKLRETENIALTSDILTLTNSTRSFLVMTAHFFNASENSVPELETVTLTAQRMYQAHTADYIRECFEDILKEFSIEKNSIHSMTTDGGSNMVLAVKKFLGDNKRIPCMAHLINLVVDAALTKDNSPVLELANQVKSIVTYFKQSVNAMDELRAEQQSLQKKEGEVLTLIQSVSTRWNSCLDMLERFNKLAAIVAKILSGRRNAPDMLTSSQLNVIRELITLLTPFKQATEDISGDHYVSASLAIPITNLLVQGLEHEKPSTLLGIAVKTSLLQGVTTRLRPLEQNLYLDKLRY
ncbi:unnamed protein product [Chilo suppressalis]|uniref:BED-type domain-containing protein n=1 Tax=Chilo suppressalis TaxID=168631 RepID=A0ABN8LCB5_CHISP|nr:unnamed protein product [Chilo suppressalis]